MTKQHTDTRRRSTSIYLILIGLSLVSAGIAAIYLLPEPDAEPGGGKLSTIPAKVNYPAPELALNDVQGSPRSLVELRGQVLLVNLWATWCPPCKKEMPTLQAFYEENREKGFTIVAINDGDPRENVVQFVRDYQLTFPVWLDPDYVATERAFMTTNLPSSFVIDREGMVRLRWVGEITADALEKYVTPIIME